MFASPLPAASATLTAPTPPPGHRVTYTYNTFLDPAEVRNWQIRKFDPVFGTMTLTFNPDKTIRGIYRPESTNSASVSGALTGGGKLWLQIRSRRFTGRFTPRGFATTSSAADPHSSPQLWGQFVHA